MNSPVFRLGVVPALVLLPLTALRVWLELNHPTSPATSLVSVFALGGLWVALTTVLLLRSGASFAAHVKTVLTFSTLYRAPIAAAYALAWANKWKTPADLPVRYVLDITKVVTDHATGEVRDLSPGMVFVSFLAFPLVVHLLVGIVLWFVVWGIGFRGRPALKACAPVGGDRRAVAR